MADNNDDISDSVLRDITAVGGWEYKIAVFTAASAELAEKQLQIFGTAGWELVTIREIHQAFDNQTWFYFKRPRTGTVSRRS